MSDIAIRVEGLSKRYRIAGPRASYATLRDSLSQHVLSPARRLASVLSGHASTESNQTIWALKDVSFDVACGEVVGVIGHNGAGKSTLLKILSEITEPTNGWADVHGRVGSLLEVGTGFHPELTGRENVFLNGAILGMKRREIASRFDNIVEFAGVERFIDTPVKHYSTGMYLRLAFSVAAHLEPAILLVDEVLAVGDAAFQKKCLGKMNNVAQEGRTVLFVSHNMGAVRQLCSRAILLDHGSVDSSGPVDTVVEEYLSQFDADASDSDGHVVPYGDQRDKGVQIVGFRACAETGNKTKAPCSLEAAEFQVTFVARGQSSRRLYVGLFVKDVLGLPIFTCSTSTSNSDFYGAPASGCVRCVVDPLPLIPGKYYVDIKLIDEVTGYGYLAGASSFRVRDGVANTVTKYPKTRSGSVIVPQRWSLCEEPLSLRS